MTQHILLIMTLDAYLMVTTWFGGVIISLQLVPKFNLKAFQVRFTSLRCKKTLEVIVLDDCGRSCYDLVNCSKFLIWLTEVREYDRKV